MQDKQVGAGQVSPVTVIPEPARQHLATLYQQAQAAVSRYNEAVSLARAMAGVPANLGPDRVSIDLDRGLILVLAEPTAK